MLSEEQTTDADVAGATPPAPTPDPGARTGPRLPLLLALGCVAIAALTLLAPSAPTYDPWAWIIWGREITQLDLVTTTGPSWKPLPVVFTTVFALFGDAAPSLWLVVARAGALAAIVLGFLVARRLGAGALAAAAAAAALATAPWWTVNAWLGNSEALLVACVLGAVLAHLHGHGRATLALAVAAGLLRPEAWPFVGLYGLWLVWRRRETWLLVAGAFAVLPLLWLAPEQWGSGDFWRAANRAQTDLTPGNAARAEDPVLEILRDFWHLLPVGLWVGVLLAAVAVLLAARRGAVPWRVIGVAVLAAAWVGIVAVMAAAGYSGNQRYLIAPAALAIVVAAVGAGAVLRLLPGALRPVAALGVLAAFALTGALNTLDAVPETRAQSRIPADLEGAVQRAGGIERLRSCGQVVTEPLLVPQVAWRLQTHLEEVEYRSVRGPATVFRAQVSPHLRPFPTMRAFEGLLQRTLATAPRWEIIAVGRCAR